VVADRLDGARAHPGRGGDPVTAVGDRIAATRGTAPATDRGGDPVTAGRHGVGAIRGTAAATGGLIGGARRASLAPVVAVAS
jgi:hypothetical protein